MRKTNVFPYGVASLLVLAVVGHAAAQNFPNKPLRIVTAETGGGNDFVARLIAHGMTVNVGQQVIVENRGGASGTIAAQAVSKASADGYTLLLYSGSLWLFPLLKSDVPWDALRDFEPITLAANSPSVLVVTPSLPVKSVQDLIALAKAKPGQLNYASGSTGASTHLGPELFKSMAGVDIVRIAYKGNAAGYTDLLAGNVQLLFGTAGGVTPFLRSGKLRALAVTSVKPSPLFPGLPAISESLPGYESVSTYGLFAPARTPAVLVRRLNQEAARAIGGTEARERFLGAGVEGVGGPPEQLTATMKSEIARIGKLIKDAGIRAD